MQNLAFFTRKCTIVRKMFDSHMKKQIILQLRNAALITSFLNIQVHIQSGTSSHAEFWQVRTRWTVQKDIYVLLWLLNFLFYTNSIHPWACSSEPLILKMCPYPETRTRCVVSYCVMLRMILNIKDLHENSGNRLKKKNSLYGFNNANNNILLD